MSGTINNPGIVPPLPGFTPGLPGSAPASPGSAPNWPGFEGSGFILDELSSFPAVAYSVRQLTGGVYARPYCMLVRRDSDNAQQNIGFVNGLLDTVGLLNFVGSANGFVVTWYNQGSLGSSADATQSTAANQPQVCANGVVETQNGVPTVYFSTGQYLATSGYMPFGAFAFSAYSVVYVPSLAPVFDSCVSMFNGASSQNGGVSFGLLYGSGTLALFKAGIANSNFTTAISAGSLSITRFSSASGLVSGSLTANNWLNGNSGGSATLSSYGAQPTGLGFGLPGGGATTTIKISETISTQSSSASDGVIYDLNAAAFYGITGVTQ